MKRIAPAAMLFPARSSRSSSPFFSGFGDGILPEAGYKPTEPIVQGAQAFTTPSLHATPISLRNPTTILLSGAGTWS